MMAMLEAALARNQPVFSTKDIFLWVKEGYSWDGEKCSKDFLLLRRDPVPLVNIEHGCQNEVKGEMDNQEKKALKENFEKIFFG